MWNNLYSQKLRIAVIKTTREISESLIKTRLNEVNDKITEVIKKWEIPLINDNSKDHRHFEGEKDIDSL